MSFKTRANISDMTSLYRGNILNSAQNINLLTLNSIQRLYKADVVIAIIKSNEQIINGVLTCGMAVDIPTPNVPLALKIIHYLPMKLDMEWDLLIMMIV